jgi:hypothetical protein
MPVISAQFLQHYVLAKYVKWHVTTNPSMLVLGLENTFGGIAIGIWHLFRCILIKANTVRYALST